MTELDQLAPGFEIGGCRIDERIGSGGMGVVYRAVDLSLDRVAAIKVIRSDKLADADLRARFVREAKLAAQLYHPNVTVVHRVGEEDGVLFCVMQWIDGRDLRQLIAAEGRLAPDRAASIVAQIGSALDVAHTRSLLHRDVKSSNILISQEQTHEHAFLSDFGIAKQTSGTSSEDEANWIAGSPGYIAPERIAQTGEDGRSDVYSLGCVLCEALIGRPPYQRSTTVEVLVAHMNDDPPPVSEVAQGVSPAFDRVIRRALAKEPKDRYATAGDLGRAALAAADRAGRRSVGRAATRRQSAPAPDAVVAQDGGGDCSTITDAIEKLSSGGRIALRPGYYREAIRLGLDDLHLFGDGPREEIIVAGTTRRPPIECAADGCRLTSLTIQHTPRFLSHVGRGIVVSGENAVIENCVVSSDGMSGVVVTAGGGCEIRGCRIRGATRGIEVKGGGSALIEGNVIFGTGYSAPIVRAFVHGDGIYAGKGSKVTVIRNKLAEVTGEGMVICGEGEIVQNDIVGSDQIGLVLGAHADADVAENQIHGGKAAGIRVDAGATARIANNDVFANDGVAIVVVSKANGVVKANRIYANRGGEIAIQPGAAAEVADNDVREDLTVVGLGVTA